MKLEIDKETNLVKILENNGKFIFQGTFKEIEPILRDLVYKKKKRRLKNMRYRAEDHIYGIETKEEFLDFEKRMRESIEKYPERKEQILVDFCNMCYRDDVFTNSDVIVLFSDYGISEREFYKKYHMNEKGIYKRNEKRPDF